MATTDEIKSWLDHADSAEQEVETLRWKAAEALFLANKVAGGGKKSQAILAAEIGRDQSTVSKYIWCWITYGPVKTGDKPARTWPEAWREATDKKRAPKPGGKAKKPKPSSDSQGNKARPDPEWASMAPEVEAARSFTQNHPGVVAEIIPEDMACLLYTSDAADE